MNEQDQTVNEAWQQDIDRLLEGRLSEAEQDRLKAQASADSQLAQAIIDAYRIQNSLESLGTYAAPRSLKQRLRAIPRQHRGPVWALAAGTALAAVIAIGVFKQSKPNEQQIIQAQQDLVVAVQYLEQYGLLAKQEMQQEIGGTLKQALIDGVRDSVDRRPPNSEPMNDTLQNQGA